MSEPKKPEIVQFIDADIEKVVLSGVLSRDTRFTLHIAGPWNPEMIDRMVEYLQALKKWLVADDELKETRREHL